MKSVKILFFLAAVVSLSACRSAHTAVATASHIVDVNERLAVADTFFIHDSVFVHEYTVKGTDTDTVFIKEYRTRYSHKAQAVHDTVTVTVRDSVPVFTAASTANAKTDSPKQHHFSAIAAILINGAILFIILKR